MHVCTIGHGTRPIEELIECLEQGGVRTLVDVRRFPGSRRNPQFNRAALEASLENSGITYRHAVDLGGRRSGLPCEDRFGCLPAFAGYAAWMTTEQFGQALERALAEPSPCLMCAETVPWRCHRLLVADLLTARGHDVLHLLRPHEVRPHRLSEVAEARDGCLYLCGSLVA
jgi:uncharacterized protein (DUF488 family)